MKWWRFGLRVTIITIAGWLLVNSVLGELSRVRSHSMEPTLRSGQCVFVSRCAYGIRWVGSNDWAWQWDEPQRGDIVVFISPHDGQRLVKRIAGIAGDVVAEGTVPANSYYLVGDHSAASHDSRHFGWVPRSAILGKVLLHH